MVEINEVLMVGETVGAPLVDGAMVTAEIVEQGRARKVIANPASQKARNVL